MNDFFQIYDFQALRHDAARFDLMLSLAREWTEILRPALERAMANFQCVYLATHVPPFVEATWHEGNPSESDFLPFFCSPTLGKMLAEVAGKFPRSIVTQIRSPEEKYERWLRTG